MQKQNHRVVGKTVENRYWQNQFHNEDIPEFEPKVELGEFEPPTLAGVDMPEERVGRVTDK
jgi:hypothetical protein